VLIIWNDAKVPKPARLSVGKEAADASARRLRKEAELNAVNNGIAVMPENGTSRHQSLAALIAEFLDETKLTTKPKTLSRIKDGPELLR
jgi:hypothetical protein